MNLKLVTAVFLLFSAAELLGQDASDHVGAGHALRFDGVDDYVDLGNIYEGLDLPITISAWIFLDPRGLGTIFASQDNTNILSGFHFYVVHTGIVIEYGDGMGTNTTNYRRGKEGPVDNIFGKWVHISAVIRGALDMDLFLNGINLGGNYIGTSQAPMNSKSPEDVAKIGYRSTTGVIYHFQGIMDELRIWNKALTVQEIREQMCKKLKGDEDGLIGYWDFDNTKANVLIDKSPNHFDGAIKGEPLRVFSGAPIGDESVFAYRDTWNGATLTLNDSLTSVTVKNVGGDPGGVHLYKVKEFPAENGELNTTTVFAPYYGVFLGGITGDNVCDVDYTFNKSPVCRLYTRKDNSVPSWTKNSPSLTNISQRIEFIQELEGTELMVDLGENETPCLLRERILSPLVDTVGFQFQWQDGSSNSNFAVTDFGLYWVKIDNGCTSVSDSLSILKVDIEDLVIPSVFTPNGDKFNEYFQIDERMIGGGLTVFNRWGDKVYESLNYQNDWNGDDLPSGVYFFTLSGGGCIEEKKGTLTILK